MAVALCYLVVMLLAWLLLACVARAVCWPDCHAEAWLCEAVVTAGQLESEADRYQALVELQHQLGLQQGNNTLLAEELASLLDTVDHWANGRDKFWQEGDDSQLTGEDGESALYLVVSGVRCTSGYLAGWFVFRVVPAGLGPAWPPEPRPTSPLHPLWALYRGRMLIWSGLENGVLQADFYNEGAALLFEAAAAFPDNPVLPQYTGEAWTERGVTEQQFPPGWEWVGPLQEAVLGLQAVARWWCETRQARSLRIIPSFLVSGYFAEH